VADQHSSLLFKEQVYQSCAKSIRQSRKSLRWPAEVLLRQAVRPLVWAQALLVPQPLREEVKMLLISPAVWRLL
jgi:hypothetical protein